MGLLVWTIEAVRFGTSTFVRASEKGQDGVREVSLKEQLDTAFDRFLSNTVSDELLGSIKAAVTLTDVDTLMKKVESLDDPSTYCRNDRDADAPAGFFLFLDFVSALIVNLGPSATQEIYKYRNSKHPFVPWVVKYSCDERFHDEIISKFSKLFAR